METIKIYRYEIAASETENSTVGAYGGRYGNILNKEKYRTLLSKMCLKHSQGEHPAIWADLNGFISGLHFCACSTLESLKYWFDGFNEDLITVGYKLVEVEVKKVYETKSKLQVAFILDDIIEKKVIESLELIK